MKHGQGVDFAPRAQQVPVCGQQVRGVTGDFALLGMTGSGAEMRGGTLPTLFGQFLRGLEGFGGGLRAKVRHAPSVTDS
ncbi:hypothetical protein E5F05_19670 [Deinococcus metallilatus]|uniref:Uncharacterized protein n=1 Tax=Deinococcus metallilatus TaxID=1211322 RepID=A0AAJ5F7D3_9DEIO|nr:hypothetical protein [Deinococcus metallilatus]MBB5296358.1 hypothetical protein [Deinococcus metallilatus]QBY09964.1 hypothetical protein E5F05_19670 [Deinococcus metallilatus]RXJ08688.1 hypothetical protein ERJ73_18510 [Deinococcus metallilatus]TLK25162.1 hypothetical protein FCS05_13425 [Deinococcus metallilatus]